jgi:hypothetical protein
MQHFFVDISWRWKLFVEVLYLEPLERIEEM